MYDEAMTAVHAKLVKHTPRNHLLYTAELLPEHRGADACASAPPAPRRG